MSQDSVHLANALRLASEMRTRTGVDGATLQEHYQHVLPTALGAAPKVLAKFLATAAGSKEMAVDGSATAVSFDLTPAANVIYRVEHITLVLVCSGAPVMTQFGNVAALANGVLLEWRKTAGAALELDLLDGIPLKTGNDLAAMCEIGVVGNTLIATWVPRSPVRLDAANGELLRATVRDNLTTLSRFRAFVEGGIETDLT